MISEETTTLRAECLRLLAIADPFEKAHGVTILAADIFVGSVEDMVAKVPVPGRLDKPVLVPHTQIKPAALTTREGHAALVHSIVHIERNAIDLALDIVWRFPSMPDEFYREWVQVAKEEAYHFTLLAEHLKTLGFDYGDFKAHDGLWSMAKRTKNDLLARVALVPRTLEARGLDASPAVKGKLTSIGDHAGAAILDIILRDEIGHVSVGNRWYRYLCEQRSLDPIATYEALTVQYEAPRLRGPFNFDARRAAGFDEDELKALAG